MTLFVLLSLDSDVDKTEVDEDPARLGTPVLKKGRRLSDSGS